MKGFDVAKYEKNGRLAEYMRQYRGLNPRERLLLRAKHASLDKNLEFNLTLADIKIPKFCPLLGIELTSITGMGRLDSNVSIDRIDSAKGYVRGNIQVTSVLANRMKNSATPEQLVMFAWNILRIYEDTTNALDPDGEYPYWRGQPPPLLTEQRKKVSIIPVAACEVCGHRDDKAKFINKAGEWYCPCCKSDNCESKKDQIRCQQDNHCGCFD